MSKRMTNLVLTILTLALLCCFAFTVPSGSLTDEADQRYHSGAEGDVDTNYLYNFGT